MTTGSRGPPQGERKLPAPLFQNPVLFPVLRRGLFTFPPPAVAFGSLLDCGPPSGINSQPRVTTPNAAAAGGGEIGAEGPDQGGLRRITPCGEQGVAAFINPATLAL